MKIVTIILLTLLTAQAFDIPSLIKAYKNKDYAFVCKKGYKLFDKLRKDENLITMYAFSCLRIDYIDRLAVPILILGKTPQSRTNRAYFSLILSQKNILTSALFDGSKFEGLHVPRTDYILSKVFNLYFQKKYKKTDNIYIMQDPTDKVTYEMSVKKDRYGKVLFIKEIRPNKTTIHQYR